ncbi:MAG TPA: tetratricopeptide repeat protein, partial [Candidatus Kapabacteria bacterium]|nr:tetratricopeptide repeat protein [Candidatus Kapabacteria bacterium]
QLHYNKAVFLAQMNKTEQAIQSYKNAIEINPYYTKSYFSLALIYESKGKKNEAIDCYKKFIQYSPKKFKDYISQAENKIKKLSTK